MQEYRPPTEEGRKQIVMRYLGGEKEESIRMSYSERGVSIGNIKSMASDPRVKSAVCLEKQWTYDVYEQKLRMRASSGPERASF